MHVEYPPMLSVSDLVKGLKGLTSRLLQKEDPHLEKRSRGRHFWGVGYGAWRSGNVTEEMVQESLEHHRSGSNQSHDAMILED